MRQLNLKSIALLAGLAVLVALAGCGGGNSSSPTEGTTVPVGKSETTTKSSPAPKQKAAKKGRQEKQKPAQLSAKKVEKEIRKLANSGQPIPADSPVAKKIIQSLTGNGGSGKQGKKGKNSIAKVVEEVVSPSPSGGGGGSGSSSSGGQGGGPGAGVEKILEQLQE